MNGKRIALIPSYEPTPVLLDVVKGMHCAGFDVVVVDDGSGVKYSNYFLAALKYAILTGLAIYLIALKKLP